MPNGTYLEQAEALLRQLTQEFPLHAAIIAAMTPSLLLREEVLAEKNPHLASAGKKLLQHADHTLDTAEQEQLQYMVHKALDALCQGFADAGPLWEALRAQVPHDSALVAKLFHVGRSAGVHVDDMPEARDLSPEMIDGLELLSAQIARLCSAAAAQAMPECREEQGLGHRLCPYCGARPELSIIHGETGIRSLSCSQCGRFWRYDRNACPHCGPIGSASIRHLYVEEQPELRAALCDACHCYLLEIDLRKRAVELPLAPLFSTVMGHLDALAAQDGANPLSLLAVTTLSQQEPGNA